MKKAIRLMAFLLLFLSIVVLGIFPFNRTTVCAPTDEMQGPEYELSEVVNYLSQRDSAYGRPDFSVGSSAPVYELGMSPVLSFGEEIPIREASNIENLSCALYLYYNNLNTPAILKAGRNLEIRSKIGNYTGENKDIVLGFALYKDNSLIAVKADGGLVGNYTERTFSTGILADEFSNYGITEETLHEYRSKIFVWEGNTLRIVTAFGLNSPKKIDSQYIFGNNTAYTTDSGPFNFIPQTDGYYDIRTVGDNINLSAVLSVQDPIYNANNGMIGYELIRVPSTSGASNFNKFTYNLKAGRIYSLKLGNSGGSGFYICKIEKLTNIMKAPSVMHNLPLMSDGVFTPIKWVGGNIVNTDSTDPEWYDYRTTENKWANIRLQDGSMFVWVPRYAYRIIPDSNSKNIYSNQIEVKYLNGLTNIAYDGTVCKTVDENPAGGDFIVHPGFTHGGITYSGLWIAKFQASSDGSGRDNSEENARFIPDAAIWRTQSMENVLKTIDKMNISGNSYGLPQDKAVLDMHLFKNSEWGAVAYLAYSTAYNTDAAANNNPNYVTGGGSYYYNTEQSTSHNLYGIYDMSGAAYEYVAAYSEEGTAKAGALASLHSVNPKYVDVIGSADKGHAISDVVDWFKDDVRTSLVVPLRGYYARGTGKDDFGFFAIKTGSISNSDENTSWRTAIWLPGSNASTASPQNLSITKQYSNEILKNPYSGRMEYTDIYTNEEKYKDAVEWNGEKLEPSMINADLFWDKIMPSGNIETINGKIVVTGELDIEYIEGTKEKLASHSPRLNKWREKDVNVVMRVILEEPNQDETTDERTEDDGDGYEIPAWLIEKVGFDNLYKKYQYDYDEKTKTYRETAYKPDYENEILIAAHEHLIKKLAAAYNNDPFVTFIQIGSIGRWGEWNEATDGVYMDGVTPVYIPKTKTADRYVRPYIKYFNKKHLSMRYPHELGKKYGVGIHDDAIANNYELNNFFGRAYDLNKISDEFHPARPYFWQNAFVHGESASNPDGKWNWFSNDIPTDSHRSKYGLENIKYIDNTIKQIEKLHLSFFKFAVTKEKTKKGKEAEVGANMKEILRILGARLWVTDLSASSVFEKGATKDITLTWKNSGIASFGFDWDVEVSLLDSNGEPVAVDGKYVISVTNPIISKCMPGKQSIQNVSLAIPENLPSGTYKLAVAILSPYTNEPCLELANAEPNYNKRYVMQTVNVQ